MRRIIVLFWYLPNIRNGKFCLPKRKKKKWKDFFFFENYFPVKRLLLSYQTNENSTPYITWKGMIFFQLEYIYIGCKFKLISRDAPKYILIKRYKSDILSNSVWFCAWKRVLLIIMHSYYQMHCTKVFFLIYGLNTDFSHSKYLLFILNTNLQAIENYIIIQLCHHIYMVNKIDTFFYFLFFSIFYLKAKDDNDVR